GHVAHEGAHPRAVLVVDVLRLGGHLVVVHGVAEGEVGDGDAVARVHVVVAAAVAVERVPRRVEGVVDAHGVGALRVERVDQVAQRGGEAPGADHLDGPRPPVHHLFGAAAAHHVHVERGDAGGAPNGGVGGE